MKRWLIVLLAAACLCMAVGAGAEVIPTKLGRGGGKKDPVELRAGTLYHATDMTGYYSITPTETGEYTFYLKKIDDRGVALQIYNEYGEKLWNRDFYSTPEGVSKGIELTAEKDYLIAETSMGLIDNLVWFSICAPSQHISFGPAEIRRAATCDTDGYMAQTCEYCGGEGPHVTIPATGHQSGGMVVMQEATCLKTGLDADTCVNCETVLSTVTTPIVDHEAGAWKTERAATCTADGYRVQLCVGCGKTMESETVPSFGHSVSEWKEERARCIADGKRYRECTVCGAELEREILPATGHQYGEWIEIMAPTVVDNGIEERSCLSCSAYEQRPVAKLTWLQGILGR